MSKIINFECNTLARLKKRFIFAINLRGIMKKFVLPFLALFVMTARAQSLTKQQMLEDYDQLYTTLTTKVPHFAVRKKVTDIDIPRELRRIRHDIDTVTCDGGFYDVIFRALIACNDMHVSPNQTKDSVAMARTKEAYQKYYRYSSSKVYKVYYIDGKYLTRGFQNKDAEVIPFFSELTHVNGIPIDKYVAKYNRLVSDATRWDFKYKKAWVSGLFDPRMIFNTDKITWTVIIDGKPQTIDMTELGYIYPRDFFDDFVFKVDYFQRDFTLYIRIPKMDYGKIEWLEDEIAKHKGEPLRRVVIDVRGNGGGSDIVWTHVLSAIIGRPMHFNLWQASKDIGVFTPEDSIQKPIKVYGDRLIACYDQGDWTKLKPSERSLGYDGKIYVMVDEFIFSSTSSFLSVCQKIDRLISIGRPTGYFVGIGATPWGDILRHSRFSYRYPVTIETTDADPRHPETYYKDQVEVEVVPTVEELRTQAFYNKAQHAEEFLYNHDWVFRKILEESK